MSTNVGFTDWLKTHGGFFHPSAEYMKVPSGFAIVAKETIPAESTVVSCPFELIITVETSLQFLGQLLPKDKLSTWSERQCIASYLCMQRILQSDNKSIPELLHAAYVQTLPLQDELRTSLYFSDIELEAFRGTNVFGATQYRKQQWLSEWEICRSVVDSADATWGERFTWEVYCASATHLSSRAFPSSLLLSTPTLLASPSTTPILLPGIDALNHARGQPVSWVVTPESSSISLLLHTSTPAGAELYNNYGLKSNAELILGYGFTLPSNPDDTIMLKVAGQTGWEIGRHGKGMEDVWDGFMHILLGKDGRRDALEYDYEDMLETADVLDAAIQNLLQRLPGPKSVESIEIRPEVATMLHDYVQGQLDILDAAIQYVQDKRQEAVNVARENGIDVVLDKD